MATKRIGESMITGGGNDIRYPLELIQFAAKVFVNTGKLLTEEQVARELAHIQKKQRAANAKGTSKD